MRHYIILLFFLLLLLSAELVSAQDSIPDRRAKAVYLDMDLMGIFGSGPTLNLDMRFKRKVDQGFGAKIGFGAWEETKNQYYRLYQAKVGGYHIEGRKLIKREVGGGVIITRFDQPYQINSLTGERGNFWKRSYETWIYFNAGFRYQPKKAGPIVRMYWAPTYLTGSFPMLVNVGLSAGWSFK